jgi:hypothetical protein
MSGNHAQLRRQEIAESALPAFRCAWLIASRHDGRTRTMPNEGTCDRKINQGAVDPLINLADACKSRDARQHPREETRHHHPLLSLSPVLLLMQVPQKG